MLEMPTGQRQHSRLAIPVVVPGRSKERSEARRLWNPYRYAKALLRFGIPASLRPTAKLTGWIIGSSPAKPEHDDVAGVSANLQRRRQKRQRPRVDDRAGIDGRSRAGPLIP
ncbi:hypothetical protein MPLSOD_30122 [Mesorhizobium sp. SOD10]|nr:hypothetical protein MPLSOD_30122 [Mesorhizobium sp. SOD10]